MRELWVGATSIVIGIIDTGLGLGWLVKLMSWAYVMRGNADL